MAGVTITATFDDGNVASALARLGAALADTAPLLDSIGVYGRDSTRERFTSQTAPSGTPWKALSPAYASLKGGGKDILTLNYVLRNSITYGAGLAEVRWGSNVVYAAVHQFGATIVPKTARALRFRLGLDGRMVFAKSVTIPARPYLGLSAEDREEIEARGGAFLRSAWAG